VSRSHVYYKKPEFKYEPIETAESRSYQDTIPYPVFKGAT